jgi:predicted dehydrogenase
MDKWWGPGLAIGYDSSFVHQVADFLAGLETGTPARPTFRDALETQRVLDAILDSARDQQWRNVATG